ncbi:flagellar export chaperone FlgN [Porcipelethomonas sp.]|uniref:flagellar export chaperone FlgN n=1 Tax=Porcipelethomonas sp. TaxID=2981675 RepID=UPI003EF26258
MENFNEFYDFMNSYTVFLEETAEKEKEKLSALLSDDLKRIEHCLNEHQSTIKRTEKFEQEREELQNRLGIGGLTFKEIIAAHEDPEEKSMLEKLYTRFKVAVDNVKHANKTSLQVAQMNLKILEEIMPSGVTDAKCYDTKGVSSSRKNIGILNTKI